MPRGQRPRSRTMAVLVEVSSMNTRRAGSNMPCSRIQRRRALGHVRAFLLRPPAGFFLKLIYYQARRNAKPRCGYRRSVACASQQRSHPASNPVVRQSAPAKRPRAPPAARCCLRSAWPQCFPFRFKRCIHLIAELTLTSTHSAASRRDAPASTSRSTRIRKSSEQGLGINPLQKSDQNRQIPPFII